jgi:ubiquinone/menaquinone biosynthesis C-methylase UbiE
MPNSGYLFSHSHSETERLVRQAEFLRPITHRLLTSAGLEKGMRVLDIGCGPGDVTILVAELVGPTGRVVGIDSNKEIIRAARQRRSEPGFNNVEFIHSDAEKFDRYSDYDAVVCRYVLIHQTDPARFLRVMTELVRPGGVIAVHEMDASRGIHSNPPIPLLHRMAELAQQAFAQTGTATDAGGRLVQLFWEAGLPAPSLFAETVVESSRDSLILPWVTDTLRQLLPGLIATGRVTKEEADIDTLTDRLRHAADAMRSQLELVPQVCGWARVDKSGNADAEEPD